MVSENTLKKIRQEAHSLKAYIYTCLIDTINESIPDIVAFSNEVYNDLLNDQVVDRNSQVRADKYQEDFLTQMYKYEYVRFEDGTVNWYCPDMSDFPFYIGRLPSLKTILEGMPYEAIEIPHENYEKITGKKTLTKAPFDSSVPLTERVYIEKSTPQIINNARNLKITLASYAYSRMPPIDIFTPIKDYMWSKHSEWIDRAQTKALKKFSK